MSSRLGSCWSAGGSLGPLLIVCQCRTLSLTNDILVVLHFKLAGSVALISFTQCHNSHGCHAYLQWPSWTRAGKSAGYPNKKDELCHAKPATSTSVTSLTHAGQIGTASELVTWSHLPPPVSLRSA